jgi:hypothetical protein
LLFGKEAVGQLEAVTELYVNWPEGMSMDGALSAQPARTGADSRTGENAVVLLTRRWNSLIVAPGAFSKR